MEFDLPGDDDIFAETGSHGPTCSCDECQEKDATGYWEHQEALARIDDEIASLERAKEMIQAAASHT